MPRSSESTPRTEGAIDGLNYRKMDFQDTKFKERFDREAQFMFLNIFNHTDCVNLSIDSLGHGQHTIFVP